jgi:hypothetical protein
MKEFLEEGKLDRLELIGTSLDYLSEDAITY